MLQYFRKYSLKKKRTSKWRLGYALVGKCRHIDRDGLLGGVGPIRMGLLASKPEQAGGGQCSSTLAHVQQKLQRAEDELNAERGRW